MVFNNILELILIFFMFINKSILVSVSIILLVLWLGLFMWWGEDYEMDDYVGETEEYEESHEGEFRENAFSEYEEYIVYEEKGTCWGWDRITILCADTMRSNASTFLQLSARDVAGTFW